MTAAGPFTNTQASRSPISHYIMSLVVIELLTGLSLFNYLVRGASLNSGLRDLTQEL